MSDPKPFKILFLCTGNSARSIFAEYLIRKVAPLKFESMSAGANPKGQVHPMTLRVLKEVHRIDASDARSKSWDEFKGQEFKFVITVCDNARESCPVWPGQPIVAHWSSEDPVEAGGDEEAQLRAFTNVSFQIMRRLELFACLPHDKLDRLRLQEAVSEIGQKSGTAAAV